MGCVCRFPKKCTCGWFPIEKEKKPVPVDPVVEQMMRVRDTLNDQIKTLNDTQRELFKEIDELKRTVRSLVNDRDDLNKGIAVIQRRGA